MATPRAATAASAAIPASMRAVALNRFGPPAVLQLVTLPVPDVGPGEILIALHAAGIGSWDAKIRDGTWAPDDARFPLVLGADGAGVVAARGNQVRRFNLGDRVWAYEYLNPKGGFYAEYIALDAEHAGPAPRSLSLRQAGAAACTGLTALQGLEDHLRLRAGETVLIFGASGGVGTLAVQFAKRARARVIGTATADAADLVKRLGADGVFNARAHDALPWLRAFAPNGLDAVLALAGGAALEICLDLIKPGGRVAHPNGVEPEPRPRPDVTQVSYDAVAGPHEFARLERAVEEARLQVPIDAVYPLAQAAQAHERLEQGHVLGRLVLEVRAD